jgi:hypothetical protein
MKFLVEKLMQAVDEIFKEGKGLDGPMSSAVPATYTHGNIRFSLQTEFGTLFSTNREMPEPSPYSWKQSAFQTLQPDDSDTTRFVFSVSSKVWEILSCFTMDTMVFYTVITLIEADTAEQSLRAGLIRLMGVVSSRCRAVIKEYIQPLLRPGESGQTSGDLHNLEKRVIRSIAEFSADIKCVSLIDHDGFIVDMGGNSDEVEKVASNLALFHQRCVRELGFMGSVNLRSETFSCNGMTMLIGQIERTSLALALSARGKHAKAYATFLFELAKTALAAIVMETGTLWGTPVDKKTDSTRVRTSWFGPIQLVAQGKYVGKKGGKAFHLSSCKSLLKSDDGTLEWFDKRAEAIRSGLTPCRTCNP